MHTHARDGASRVGLIVAMVLGGVAIGVLGWMLWTGINEQALDDDDLDVPPIIDILRGTESGGGLSLQFADSEDLSRIASKLEAEELRPVDTAGVVEQHLYHLEKVRAWVYLRSGETILIESQQGRFYMPDRKAGPESGSLIGTPKITVFAQGPLDAEPLLVANFDDVLRFNLAYSHIESPGRVVVTGRDIAFAGSYLTARINEQRQRIDVLEVAKGESLVFTPPPRAQAEPLEQNPAPPTIGRASGSKDRASVIASKAPAPHQSRPGLLAVAHQASEPSEPQQHVAHYLATFSDSVELSQGTKRLTADKLEAWARLIDHKIPDRTRSSATAHAPADVASHLLASMFALQDGLDPDPQPLDDQSAEHTDEQSPPAGEDSQSSDAPIEQEPVVLRWTGMLRVVPLVEPNPTPLRSDDVVLRFTAVSTGMVHYHDVTTTGRAVSIDYAMTREELTMLGPGGAVRLADENAGWIEGSKVVARLGSGEVTVVGPGQIYDAAHVASGPNRHEKAVRWIDQADFRFAVEDGRMTGRIEQADIAGEARAIDGKQFVTGEMLIAKFGVDDSGNPVLTQVEAYEATASDGTDSSLAARRFVVPMTTIDGITSPTGAFASGAVLLSQGQRSLFADVFSADLSVDEKGDVVVGDVVGERGVVYRDGDTIEAHADRLEANGLDAVAVLLGENGNMATIDYETAIIAGPRIELEQHSEKGRVIGAGRFERDADGERTEAAWTEALHFDRGTGRIETFGDSRVEQTIAATGERRVTEGEHITVELRKVDGRESLDTATVLGSTRFAAHAEIRKHDEAGRLVELLDLLSTEVLVKGGGNELIVPRKGRLLVLDHRPDGEQRTGALEGWERGRALMTWQDQLLVDRAIGQATLTGDARVIQKPLNSDQSSELAASSIVVAFAQTAGEEFDITAVLASGTAYARFEGREVIADQIHFDRARQMIFATGTEREPVRMLDLTTGAVTNARSLSWNLATDRIEINQPSPIFMPRGE